jgi:hypothetical protein
MAREHDTRSRRTKDLTVEDPRAEKLRQAFENAPTLINGAQADGIRRLLESGEQADGTVADPIPYVVAVAGVGMRGEDEEGEPVKSVGLLDAEGRSWSVTAAGAVWPGGTGFQEARRARG